MRSGTRLSALDGVVKDAARASHMKSAGGEGGAAGGGAAAGNRDDDVSSCSSSRCEWCGQESDRLEQIRHWEEHGSFDPPLYWVCPKCAEKEREGFEAASAEWAAYMEPRYTTPAVCPEDSIAKPEPPKHH
jgi:hypothetical protein